MHNRQLGLAGEDSAKRHLEQLGLVVLSRNWRCRHGELDLVATDGHQVIFCEVKTRSGLNFGHPAEAISPTKEKKLRTLAYAWLAAHHVGWCPVRFDVLAVLWPPGGEPRIEHLEEVL